MRISTKMMADNSITLIGRNYDRMAELNSQVSSTKRIQNPHDDPVGAGQVLNLRTVIAANETYTQNIAVAKEWLTASEAVMTASSDIIQRGIADATQGSGDTIGSSERAGLAKHVDGLISDMLTQLNSKHRDTYLLAGQKITTQPYTAVGSPITSVTFNGDANSRQIEIEPNQTVAVNVDGSNMVANVLNPLIALRDALNANDTNAIATGISSLQGSLANIQQTITDLGSRQQRLTDVGSRLETLQNGLRSLLSKTEDTDMASAISELQQENTTYQASLQASARIGRTNLFDYLG